MRLRTIAPTAIAFLAGFACWPLARAVLPAVQAETSSLAPAVIDLAALTHDELPATGNPEMRARGLVATADGTVSVQSGNIGKHRHMHSDEIQYIIEGSGAMWLGDERRAFNPGSLIVIPRGTAHGGSIVVSGPVKAIAIKLPPAQAGDTEFLK